MIEVEVKIPKQIENLVQHTYNAQKIALSRSGYSASKMTEKQLQKLAIPKHPLSQYFISGVHWTKTKRQTNAYASLAPFSRYLLHGSSIVTFGFGYFPHKRRGKFDATLQRVARGITQAKTTRVTPALRRKLAATKGILGNDAGKTYFPLRKSTMHLHKPARRMPIQPSIAMMITTFNREFNHELKRRKE